MRRVYIDGTTTGLEMEARLIEIALIEEVDGKRTGKSFNQLINPNGMPMTEAAINVTGYSDDFLKQYPEFYEVADTILEFIDDAELVFWDVKYILSFLNREFHSLGKTEILEPNYVIAPDVRTIIKKNHPHLTTLRYVLYQHFDIKVNENSQSWVQENCLGMSILYQKIK